MNIYLIGFMGSGKSTVGQALAQELGHAFIDTDAVIESKENKSVKHIFEQKGETYFRNLESEVLHDIKDQSHTIISTGGGMPCYNNNIDLIKNTGVSIYLHLKSSQLAKRLIHEKEERPLIKAMSDEGDLKGFIQEKVTEREKIYFQASIICDASVGLATLVQELKNEIHTAVEL